MLNTTILSLTLGSLSLSPFISLDGNFRASKCFFSHMFNSPLFSKKFMSFIAEESSFKNILSNGIYLDSASYNDELISKHLYIYEYGSVVSIRKCTFYNCVSEDDNGGGAYIRVTSGGVDISQSGFTQCKSLKKSGAFYVSSKKLQIEKTCISTCTASDYDAFYFYGVPESTIDIKTSYIYNMNPDALATAAIYIDSTIDSIQNSNFTHFHKNGIKTQIELCEYTSLSMRYNLFSELTGTSILYFHNFKSDSPISYLNFVKNRATDALIHISDGYGKFLYCYFMDDESSTFSSTYGRFEHCFFNEKEDKSKFPNNDYRVDCVFDCSFQTYDIDIPDEQKNQCWLHLPTSIPIPTSSQVDPSPTSDSPSPSSDSSSTTTTTSFVIIVAILIICVCIAGYFIYKWYQKRNSQKNILKLYSQV